MKLLGDATEHDRASKRRRQCRNQYAVIAARNHAGHSAGRIAAETIRDEPLARDERLRRRIRRRPWNPTNGFSDAHRFGYTVQWIFASVGRMRRRGPGARTTADSAGKNHWLSG